MKPSDLEQQLHDVQLEILKQIAKRHPLQNILDSTCRRIEQLVPESTCSILGFEADSGLLVFLSAPGVPPDLADSHEGRLRAELASVCGAAVRERRTVIVADTWVSDQWRDLRATASECEVLSCWSVPLFASDDELLGAFAISRTITGTPSDEESRVLETACFLLRIALEWDLAERAVDKQRALLNSILACAEDPISARDLGGRYLLANSAETLGLRGDPGDLLGKTVFDLYPPKDASILHELDQSVLQTGRGREDEFDFETARGGRRRFRIRTDPLVDETGTTCGTVSVSRDVSRLRKTETAMARAQRLESLGVLAGGIAHDFNNLLTGISGNLDLAIAGSESDSEVLSRLMMARTAAGRAADLTNQMFAYAGRSPFKREVVSLPKLVTEAYNLVRGIVESNADITFDFAGDLPELTVEGTQIRQVVLNLLLNASEAMGERRGHISVSIRRTKATAEDDQHEFPTLRLRVRDSGSGMTPETVERVFDPFFTTKFTGRGLGLAAVKGILQTHGGKIHVESELGIGTVIDVYLPVGVGPGTSVERDKKNTEVAVEEGASILVIDDEETVLDLVRAVLLKSRFRVYAASDGYEGVEQFQKYADQIELVLLDRTLPRLGGLEVLKQLKEIRPDIRVILSSGYPDGDKIGTAASEQIESFLKKPYRPEDLVTAVRKALGPGLFPENSVH